MVKHKIDLAVDLDEVTFDYLGRLRELIVAARGTDDLPPGQPNDWSFVKAGWFDSVDEYRVFHGEAVENGLYENLDTIKGAVENLQDLASNGFRINIITSRFVNPGQHQSVVSQTARALDSNNIPYKNIMFLSDKSMFRADAFIDDSPGNIEKLRNAGQFIIGVDTAYNQDSEPSIRAKSWTEIREILRERFGR